jgi:hypothetical protein
MRNRRGRPGMVDHRTGRILNAPTLGWKQVDLRDALRRRDGVAGAHRETQRRHACWLRRGWDGTAPQRHTALFTSACLMAWVSALFSTVKLVRGHDNTAGDGHVPLSLDGPKCMCGASGCWEAYVSNIATLSRYFGRDLSKIGPKPLVEANGRHLYHCRLDRQSPRATPKRSWLSRLPAGTWGWDWRR